MDFAGKNFTMICKIILAFIIISVFIRIIPLLVVAGIVLFFIFKIRKYFKNKKNPIVRSENKHNIDKDKFEPFDISHKKIIDVDYCEVDKSNKS